MCADSQKIKEHVLTQIHSSQKLQRFNQYPQLLVLSGNPQLFKTFPKTLHQHLFYSEAFLKTQNWLKSCQSSIKQSTRRKGEKKVQNKLDIFFYFPELEVISKSKNCPTLDKTLLLESL
jgi:hypothetical protein